MAKGKRFFTVGGKITSSGGGLIRPVRIREILLVLLAIVLGSGCNQDRYPYEGFPYPELLSKEEGRFYILSVQPATEDPNELPRVLTEAIPPGGFDGGQVIFSLKTAHVQYPELHIDKAPIYWSASPGQMCRRQNVEQMPEDLPRFFEV